MAVSSSFQTLAMYAILAVTGFCVIGGQAFCHGQDVVTKSSDKKVEDSLGKVKSDQAKLAQRYKALEDKLYTLYEIEKSSNPTRSKLLERAFKQSQEKMTTGQLTLVVELMQKAKYKDAESEQTVALTQLTQLLELLQSDDQSKVLRDEIERYQDYAKEVDRILRIQKGIRGQTEGGVDAKRLAKSEGKASQRTGDLADEIEKDESGDGESKSGESKSGEGKSGEGKSGEGKSGEGKSGEGKSGEGKSGEGKSGEGKSGEGKSGEGKSGEGKAGEGKAGEGKAGEGKAGEGKAGEGKAGEGKAGEGKAGADGNEPPSQSSSAQQIQQKIKAARKKMDDAEKALEEAKRDNAIAAMRDAEKQLEAAKRELEAILRQLREEEIQQTLAMLEDRFRQMLEKQVRVYEATIKLNKTPTESRGTEFEISAGKLGGQESAIAADAGRALLLLKEDGTSVAFPATVEELQQDMIQVANRLAAAKVNAITIGIEEDILESLNYIIEALVKTQEDMEKMKQQKQQQNKGQGKPGDKPLVDQLAEIKLLKGLQERILRRHQRYSKFLDDPNDPVGATDDPDVANALQRLADRQAQLTQIARELVNEKNK